MKSLEERQKARAQDREDALKAKDFNNAEFLRSSKPAENNPGDDTSKGSTEGSKGDGTKDKADGKSDGKSEGGTGGNANKSAKPLSDAEKARLSAAQGRGGAGWGSQGVGGNAGTPGGPQSNNPQS